MSRQKKQKWESLEEWLAAELYDPAIGLARIKEIRCLAATGECIDNMPPGRSINDVIVENYRVLLRRIAELEGDVDELLKDGTEEASSEFPDSILH